MTDQPPSNLIKQVTNRSVDAKVQKIAQSLNVKVRSMQSQFFMLMSQKIVGSTGPPQLDKFTPTWESLRSSRYQDYRLRKFNIARTRFYEFRSRKGEGTNLKDLLSSVRESSVFGSASVTVRKTTVFGKTRNQIVVDLFPKVSEDIFTGKIDAKTYLKARNRRIAWRLQNWRGSTLRPIFQPFMQWWLKVKISQVIKSGVKA